MKCLFSPQREGRAVLFSLEEIDAQLRLISWNADVLREQEVDTPEVIGKLFGEFQVLLCLAMVVSREGE
jgi:hypothetical protein